MLLWSALWRAQVSHIAVFALIPGIAALSRAAIGRSAPKKAIVYCVLSRGSGKMPAPNMVPSLRIRPR